VGVRLFRVAQWMRSMFVGQVLGLLVPVSSNPLPGFHVRPINPVVYLGALPQQVGGRPHLEASFPLRCFQRLSLPNVANQPCTWRYNWHTRGSSVPVLSY
jgi:hypothetical protein